MAVGTFGRSEDVGIRGCAISLQFEEHGESPSILKTLGGSLRGL